MMYNYLFYKSYQLAQRSKNFEDAPVIGGIWGILLGFMFNVFTVIFIIDAVFQSSIAKNSFFIRGKYIVGIIFIASLWLYFRRGKRWQRIVAKYERREALKGKGTHPAIILIIYYTLSAVLLLLSAMYKNGDGIFA